MNTNAMIYRIAKRISRRYRVLAQLKTMPVGAQLAESARNIFELVEELESVAQEGQVSVGLPGEISLCAIDAAVRKANGIVNDCRDFYETGMCALGRRRLQARYGRLVTAVRHAIGRGIVSFCACERRTGPGSRKALMRQTLVRLQQLWEGYGVIIHSNYTVL